jgi:hypothetical protein
MKPVNDKGLKALYCIEFFLRKANSVCIIYPGHHFAKLCDVTPCDKEMLIKQERVLTVDIILDVTLGGMSLGDGNTGQLSVCLENKRLRKHQVSLIIGTFRLFLS